MHLLKVRGQGARANLRLFLESEFPWNLAPSKLASVVVDAP